MTKEKKNKWKNRLNKASLLLSPAGQLRSGKRVVGNQINKLKKNKKVQNVVKTVKEGAKDFKKKVSKTVTNVNPQSEINKKINKKKEEVASGNIKARSQLSTLQRKKKGIKLSDVRAAQKQRITDSARSTNTDFQAYKKGNMSLSEFIRKNPNSNTAKEAKKKGSSLNRKLAKENKKKVTKSGYRR